MNSRRAATLRHPTGQAPWPTNHGDPWNASTSPAAATATGDVLWTSPLPDEAWTSIAVAADGRIFVTSGDQLLAVDPDGSPAWRIACGPLGYLAALADGRLVVSEADPEPRFAVRNQDSGELAAVVPGPGRQTTITPSGKVAYVHTPPEAPSELRVFDLEGKLQWARPLADAGWFSILAFDRMMLIGDRSLLKAFDPDGSVAWVSTHEHLEEAPTDDRLASLLSSSDWAAPGPVTWIADTQVLVAFGNRGYRILDVESRTVRPLGAHLLPTANAALPDVPGVGPLLISETGRKKDRHGLLTDQHIGMHDLTGQCLWERSTGIRPHILIADGAGKTIVACSPSLDHWKKHEWSKPSREAMLEQCYIRCLNSTGDEVFTWHAGAPFMSQLAIGAKGELYVAARGKLWAIG